MCKPKESGDLKVEDIKTFNIALLGKWICRLANIRDFELGT